MNVGELIELLQRYPNDMPVEIWNEEWLEFEMLDEDNIWPNEKEYILYMSSSD